MLIFVLGTGRSGTHWIAHILDSHPAIRTTIEHPPIFDLATQAALHPRRRAEILPALRALYRDEERRSRPQHHADKSHPVIWYADTVADWFFDARFVAIERSPYGTVASMLRHGGILWWQHDWERYGFPNPFLGVDASNVDDYARASPARRAAWRWLSHHRQLERLRAELAGRLLVLDYETMVADHRERTSRLWGFLDLTDAEDGPGPDRTSLDAWRDQLTHDEVVAIEQVTGVPVP
jgi:hypothetical protein